MFGFGKKASGGDVASITLDSDNVDEVMKETEKAINRALTIIGGKLETYAALELENHPRRIDTGLLRNSITWAKGGEVPNQLSYSGDNPSQYPRLRGTETPSGSYSGIAEINKPGQYNVYIGTNVEYAVDVHEGTSTMTANRFLKKAIVEHQAECQQILESELQEVSQKYNG